MFTMELSAVTRKMIMLKNKYSYEINVFGSQLIDLYTWTHRHQCVRIYGIYEHMDTHLHTHIQIYTQTHNPHLYICMNVFIYMEYMNTCRYISIYRHMHTGTQAHLYTCVNAFVYITPPHTYIISIILSYGKHGYPWPSLSTSPYHSSPLVSGLHPVSSHSCCMYVRAGRPAFDWPYAGVHRSTSLTSSSLLLQQCPACLVRLAWIVFVILFTNPPPARAGYDTRSIFLSGV